jgi:hypothetical protein
MIFGKEVSGRLSGGVDFAQRNATEMISEYVDGNPKT